MQSMNCFTHTRKPLPPADFPSNIQFEIQNTGGYHYEQSRRQYQQSCDTAQSCKLYRRGLPLLSDQLSLGQHFICCTLFRRAFPLLSGVIAELWIQLSSCCIYGNDHFYLFCRNLSDPAKPVDSL